MKTENTNTTATATLEETAELEERVAEEQERLEEEAEFPDGDNDDLLDC